MTENTTKIADTTSSRGAQWAGAGSLIAIAAQSLLNGGIGGLFGGGYGYNQMAQAGNTIAAVELARKDSEIALLKAGADTDRKLVDVYTTLRKQDKEQDAILASLGTRISALETAAPLRERIVLDQVHSVATASERGFAGVEAQIHGIQATLSKITALHVPANVVCPEPMPLKNAWVDPSNP